MLTQTSDEIAEEEKVFFRGMIDFKTSVNINNTV